MNMALATPRAEGDEEDRRPATGRRSATTSASAAAQAIWASGDDEEELAPVDEVGDDAADEPEHEHRPELGEHELADEGRRAGQRRRRRRRARSAASTSRCSTGTPRRTGCGTPGWRRAEPGRAGSEAGVALEEGLLALLAAGVVVHPPRMPGARPTVATPMADRRSTSRSWSCRSRPSPRRRDRCDRSPLGTFDGCPLCGGAMAPEHAHFRCTACGWRDSCCD